MSNDPDFWKDKAMQLDLVLATRTAELERERQESGRLRDELRHSHDRENDRASMEASIRKTARQLRSQKDGAYAERNRCVALIARLALLLGWRAGVGQHPAEDTAWDADWRTIVFVDLPTGQASWHLHDSHRGLVEGLPAYEGRWDGHSTDEKYRRLESIPTPKGPHRGIDWEDRLWSFINDVADPDSVDMNPHQLAQHAKRMLAEVDREATP